MIVMFAPAQQVQSRDELQKQQKQLQKEIDELNNTLSSIRKNKKQSLGQLAIVQRKVAAREQLINNINKEIHHIDEDIYGRELERNRLNRELDTLRQKYAQSIVFAYKNRSSYEYLNFLFSASDFNDALKRMTYLKSYRKYRETEAQTILKTQDLLKQTIGTLNNSKVEKGKVLVNQSSQLKVLEQDKKEKDQVVQQLKDQEKDLIVQQKRKERQRQELKRALDAAIRREIEEAQRKERLARQRALEEQKRQQAAATTRSRTEGAGGSTTVTKPRTNEPLTGVTKSAVSNRSYSSLESTPEGLTQSINFEKNRGRLPWPISSGIVIAHFGEQSVPGTKLREVNDGIFISTQVGAAVKCVADGEVAAVINLNEYQAVLVKHGKYFTTYSKLSDVSVSKGQQVSAGTVVGRAAADFEGGGEIEFIVMNEKNMYLDPERWLKSR
jgi:septal ring factor EnvC (AmiA/AmiB activator)